MSVGNTVITDLDRYNSSMAKSLIDKIYFYDKVDVDTFIDFGCADGTLLKFMAKLFPDKKYIGYDRDSEMIEKATVDNSSVEFTDNLKDITNVLRPMENKDCLILSSVIHEVYAYGASEVNNFWREVFSLNADYIAIRDMMVSNKTSRPSHKHSVARVRQLFPKYKLDQWEAQWGSLEENWSLVHFFLTYRYTDNWDREFKENYLPISYENLLQLVPLDYDIHFVEHYSLPFLVGEVWKDFHVQLQDPTHIKLILRKVKNKPRGFLEGGGL